MKGNALGMEYETPGNGLKLYGEGNLKSRITMSQNGFRADGAVTMNGTDFKSSDILMTPDSMMTATKQITVDSVADRRPGAVGKEVQIKYLRKDKNLMATSTTLPFSVYNDRIKHAGTLFVYQDRMNASGTIEMKDASLSSTLFHLQDHNILSEHTDLQLSSLGNKNIQLNTANVKANIDLALNKGKFMNNEDANKADFPSNKYECSFRSFVWYMDEAYLNIGIEDEKELHRIWQMTMRNGYPTRGRIYSFRQTRPVIRLLLLLRLQNIIWQPVKYNVSGSIISIWPTAAFSPMKEKYLSVVWGIFRNSSKDGFCVN